MQPNPELVEAVWQLTQPSDNLRARRYREALNDVLLIPDRMAHYQPFYSPKKDGGRRLIFAAQRDLLIVQGFLADWLKKFPLGDDYCLGRRGPRAAVRRHLQSSFALVIDLRNAYESVTAQMISRMLKLHLQAAGQEVNDEVISLIVDLLAVKGRPRQGCISTPFVFNLVVKPLDDQLKLLMKQFGLSAVTRWVDNICASSSNPFDFDALERQIRRLVGGNGFTISRSERFDDRPIIYLGTKIWGGELSLADEKHGEFYFRLLEATHDQNPNPEIYRRQVGGIWSWAHHICGEEIPRDLLDLFRRYYSKVGRTPPALAEILARRLERRMF